MNINDVLLQLREELQSSGDEQTRKQTLYFFKEHISCYGIKSALVKSIGNEFFKEIKHLTKHQIFDICENLWQSEMIEENMIACNWSYKINKQYSEGDILIFEKWIDRYVNNWACCDTFCNHNVGILIEMYPQHIEILKKWSQSSNRWMKRAAAVSLIIPAKKGLFTSDIFEISDSLLTDKDDMVQKGYGWLLKVNCTKYQKEVFDYVMKNKHQMPRTALRYAIEKMPADLKVKAMEK